MRQRFGADAPQAAQHSLDIVIQRQPLERRRRVRFARGEFVNAAAETDQTAGGAVLRISRDAITIRIERIQRRILILILIIVAVVIVMAILIITLVIFICIIFVTTICAIVLLISISTARRFQRRGRQSLPRTSLVVAIVKGAR